MIGKTLAHYDILDLLGRGGMGEVYRARDTKLGREVALKILPQELSGDPERAARFDREARLLASLQHAYIASIYGFERDQGTQFLAMELVEGQTLEDRLREGALSKDEALRIARQMAAGLEAAHEKGIIHRDLKPANVMLTGDGDVKILDFGLARAWFGEADEEDIGASPTITAAMTQAGTILGTAAYMSPEQARGKSVDRRADIWAFGAILWELVTGNRLFAGETISDTLAAVIRAEPEWETLPATEQPVLCHLIERCLVRDPRQRLRDIGEARVLLESDPDQLLTASMIGAPAAEPATPSRRPLLIAVLLTAALAVAGGLVLGQALAPAAPEAELLHASLLPPPETAFSLENGGHFALSPDGSHLVFVAVDSVPTRNLWVRELSRPAAYMLTGTQDASYPFWSPDGTEIGFFAEGKMKRIPRSGGMATVVCDAVRGRGGSWGTDDRILFAPSNTTEIHVVPATGGTPRAVTRLDSTATSHRWPLRLPDGDHFLYTAQDPAVLRWGSLASDEGGVVREDALRAHFSQGELIFGQDGALWAQAFDADTRELLGEERLVSDATVMSPGYSSGAYSAAATGRLVYAAGQIESSNRLLSYDKEGNLAETLTFSATRVEDQQFSPDGAQLAVTLNTVEASEEGDIWIRDLARGTVSRVTAEEGASDPVWAPTQDRLAYRRGAEVVVRSLRGDRQVLLEARDFGRYAAPHYWTRDGRRILCTFAPVDSLKIGWFDVEDPSQREVLVADGQYSYHPSLSPDERWIVYGSLKTGTSQVYLRDLEGRGEVFQVTRDSGSHSQWSPDGREIYYYDGSANAVGAVTVEFTPNGPVLGSPRVLFKASIRGGIDVQHKLRVSPRGDRFLLPPGGNTLVSPLQIVSD
jgi:Tol biopolymer transport system component/predicted Ser/Thr protein kinase